jgi:hypothetical protein
MRIKSMISLSKLVPAGRLARNAGAALMIAAVAVSGGAVPAQEEQSEVDTALIVSVDVSSSVDQNRYQLQMEGIAAALEDPEVLNAILGGPKGSILFSMVTWADRSRLSVPWTVIDSKEKAKEVAARIRTLPQQGGEFTCLARMLRYVADKVIARIPAKANKLVVDVSGDGPDNCNTGTLIEAARTDLFASGVTINGLPILEGADAATIEGWYRDQVIGGPGAFLMPAQGYDDVARAFRQKFVVEISAAEPAPDVR